MSILGSLRRINRVEAEVVLASGVYLSFRLKPGREPAVRNLVEIDRYRAHVPKHTFIPIDAGTYDKVRRAIVREMLQYREMFRLPPALRIVVDEPRGQYRVVL